MEAPIVASPALELELVKSWKAAGGYLRRYRHVSAALGGLPAVFSVYLPPAAEANPAAKLPAVLFLAGLTCTDENFMVKAGALHAAAARNLVLVTCDTSPRGANLGPEETASWDFGVGAGFYLDATRAPYATHYRMASYVDELRALLVAQLPVDGARMSISGHSMGGLGALRHALAHPGLWRSVSVFAPICHPSACPWGRKAFAGYLASEAEWARWDPTELVKTYDGPAPNLLVDQGDADEFLAAGQLLPEDFLAAARAAGECGVGCVDDQWRHYSGPCWRW
jgi:S-formylglutathione hydrolase